MMYEDSYDRREREIVEETIRCFREYMSRQESLIELARDNVASLDRMAEIGIRPAVADVLMPEMAEQLERMASALAAQARAHRRLAGELRRRKENGL